MGLKEKKEFKKDLPDRINRSEWQRVRTHEHGGNPREAEENRKKKIKKMRATRESLMCPSSHEAMHAKEYTGMTQSRQKKKKRMQKGVKSGLVSQRKGGETSPSTPGWKDWPNGLEQPGSRRNSGGKAAGTCFGWEKEGEVGKKNKEIKKEQRGKRKGKKKRKKKQEAWGREFQSFMSSRRVRYKITTKKN